MSVLPPPLSLTQVVERLPAHARRKYDDLKALLGDAEALQKSLMERIKAAEDKFADISRRYEYSREVDLVAELEAARAALDRLEKERSRRNGVRANTEQVVSRINNFLLARMSGAVEIAPPPRLRSVPAGRKKGESIGDALLRTRREIAAAQNELMRIRTAPLPKEEIGLVVIGMIDQLAAEGRPQVVIEGGKVALHLSDTQTYAAPGQALAAPAGSASRLLSWLFHDELIKKLLKELKEQLKGIDDKTGGIPASERPERIREAEERIFALEVVEEKPVMSALAAGLEVHRRPDASPWAVLGYGAVEEAVPAEAAE